MKKFLKGGGGETEDSYHIVEYHQTAKPINFVFLFFHYY